MEGRSLDNSSMRPTECLSIPGRAGQGLLLHNTLAASYRRHSCHAAAPAGDAFEVERVKEHLSQGKAVAAAGAPVWQTPEIGAGAWSARRRER